MKRILVTGALPLSKAVLITDPSHQVLEACDPSACLLTSRGHQVQGLHVFSIVETEATVWVKAALCIALEDLRLLTLTHLPDGVDGNCGRTQQVGELAVEGNFNTVWE